MSRQGFLISRCVPTIVVGAILSVWGGDRGRQVEPSFVWEILYRTNELPDVTRSPYLSPTDITISPDHKTLYVAQHTARRVDFLPAENRAAITRSVFLPKEPNGLALSPDGSLLYVTCSSDSRPDGIVCVINTATGVKEKLFPAGHSVRCPVVSPDGSKLYVCNRFLNHVAVYQTGSFAKLAEIPVQREPYAAALTPDGSRLVVANFLPYGPSNVWVRQAVVSIINTATNENEAEVKLTNGAQSVLDIAISSDGRYAYAVHVRSNFTQTPLKPITGGWINANGLSVVDIQEKKLVNALMLDAGPYGGAANPWAIACNGEYAVIVTAGSGEIHVLDLAGMFQAFDSIGVSGLSSDDIVGGESLSLSVALVTRKATYAEGVRCVALAGDTAFLPGYFSETIDMWNVAGGDARLAGWIKLHPGEEPTPKTPERRGEQYFCDAEDLCLGGWQSCHSCHPFGRSDALKWDLENDGNGNYKNDKSLLYAHITKPSMITGVRGDAMVATRSGLKYILFVEPTSVEEKATNIDEYLASLRAVPSPYLQKGRLSDAARRGKKVFYRLNCHQCHPAKTYFTDKKQHIGLKGADDIGKYDGIWDTPTLHEVWRTAPYFHDGRTTDMKDLY